MSGGGVAGPLPRISAYAASKIAVVRFMEGLSKEVEDYNIKVNTVAPGAINTDMLKEILKSGPKKIGKHYFEKALIQKSKGGTSSKDVCNLVMLLSSTYNLNISGKILHAKWDDWKNLSKYEKVLSGTDIYTLKRVSPSDRGFKWKKRKK